MQLVQLRDWLYLKQQSANFEDHAIVATIG
jgi:hypothetical protein